MTLPTTPSLGVGADDVGARRRGQPAADADAVVDAVGDRVRRQPGREAEVVEPIEVADLGGQDAEDAAGLRSEARPIDPHADHRRAGPQAVDPLDRGQLRAERRDVRRAGPDDRPKDGRHTVRLAHHEERLRGEADVLHGQRRSGGRHRRRRPSGCDGTRGHRGRRWRTRRTGGHAPGTRAAGPDRRPAGPGGARPSSPVRLAVVAIRRSLPVRPDGRASGVNGARRMP